MEEGQFRSQDSLSRYSIKDAQLSKLAHSVGQDIETHP
jgi:hypothetical protein